MTNEFDRYAEDYDSQHRRSIQLSGEEPEYFANYKIQILVSLAQQWGLSNPKILNFGSGIGNSIPAFRKFFPDIRITNADVSLESLKHAVAKHGNEEPFLFLENGRIPVGDQSFDLIFAACVFHHIPQNERMACLQELKRVTVRGGYLVIFEHNPWNPLTRHAVANCPFDVNAELITARRLRRMMSMAGWNGSRSSYRIFFPAFLAMLRRIEPYLGWLPLGGQYLCSAQRV